MKLTDVPRFTYTLLTACQFKDCSVAKTTAEWKVIGGGVLLIDVTETTVLSPIIS